MSTPLPQLDLALFDRWKHGERVDPFPVTSPLLAKAKTIRQVNRGLSRELARILPHRPRVRLHSDDTEVDVDVARHFADGILLAAPFFPQARVAIHTHPLGYQPQARSFIASPRMEFTFTETSVLGRGDISVAAEWLEKDPAKRRFWEFECRLTPWLYPGRPPGATTPTGIGIHAYVQTVASLLTHPEWRNRRVVPGYPNSLCRDIEDGVAQSLGIPTSQVTRDEVQQVLGDCAAVSLHKATAEAGVDVILNGPNANEINRYIFKRLENSIRPFTPGPAARLQVWRGREKTLSALGFGAYLHPGEFAQPPTRRRFAGNHQPWRPNGTAEVAGRGFPPPTTSSTQDLSRAPGDGPGAAIQPLLELGRGPDLSTPSDRGRDDSPGPAR